MWEERGRGIGEGYVNEGSCDDDAASKEFGYDKKEIGYLQSRHSF
jgi:hypothetical protein